MSPGLPLLGMEPFHASAKQQTYAPKTCQTDHRVNDAADDGTLAPKEPCHQVELEKTYKPPVDGTDNGKDQSDCIHIYPSVISLWTMRSSPYFTELLYFLLQRILLFCIIIKKEVRIVYDYVI